jgi:hypothetical protein
VRRPADVGYSTLLSRPTPARRPEGGGLAGVLPDDPAAAAEEIQRRREELGFSYFAFGADVADALAPVVGELTGQQGGDNQGGTRA